MIRSIIHQNHEIFFDHNSHLLTRYDISRQKKRGENVELSVIYSFPFLSTLANRRENEQKKTEQRSPPRDTFYQRVLLGYRIHLVHTWIRNSTRRKEEEREREMGGRGGSR